MSRTRFWLILVLLVHCAAASARAQAGALDPGFESALMSGTAKAFARQADGKIIAGGTFYVAGAEKGVVRLHADGTLDATFTSAAGPGVTSVGLQSDGRIVVAGSFALGGYAEGLARLEASGAHDASFRPVAGQVQALAIQPDGRILIAGGFSSLNGETSMGLARLLADGTTDRSFIPALRTFGSSGVRPTLTLQPDGRILATGNFHEIATNLSRTVARLQADGSLDAGFSASVSGSVAAAAWQTDGRIVLGGAFRTDLFQNTRPLLRLNADGSPDSTFSAQTATSLFANAVALEPDGKVLALLMSPSSAQVGFTPSQPANERKLLRFNRDGTLDATFAAGADADGDILALQVLADGTALVGGAFTRWDGWSARAVAKIILGEVTSAPAAPAQLTATRESRTRVALSWVNASGVNGFRVERFDGVAWRQIGRTRPGGFSFSDPAAWAGVPYEYRVTAWNALGSATSSAVAPALEPPPRAGKVDPDFAPKLTNAGNFSLATPAPDGRLLVAGDFQFVNGAARRKVAQLAADGTVDPRFIADTPADATQEVRSLAMTTDGRVAVCYGTGQSVSLGFSFDDAKLLTILTPDGQIEREFSSSAALAPLPQNVSITRAAARGNVIYFVKATVGPAFGNFFPNTVTYTVEADGLANAAALRPGFNGTIKSLVPLADGSVLISGSFTLVNGTSVIIGGGNTGSRPGVARLQPDLSLDPWTPSGLPSGTVLAAQPGPGGTTFVAVAGNVIGGTQTQIIRLLPNGALDPAFPAVPLPATATYANPFQQLAVAPDGSLILTFSSAVTVSGSAGAISSRLLRYDAAGALDEAWSSRAGAASAGSFLALNADGRVLLAEPNGATDVSGNALRPLLRRLESDGSAGVRLAEAQRTGSTSTLAVCSDGAVVVTRGGARLSSDVAVYSAINGAAWTAPALLLEDGSLDPSFGFITGGSAGGLTLSAGFFTVFDPLDRLLVGGSFSQFNGFPRTGLARLHADASTDQDFVPVLPLSFSVAAVAFRPEARLAVGAFSSFVGGPFFREATSGGLASLSSEGRADIANAEIGSATAMATQPDGGVLFIGAHQRDGATRRGLARLTADNRIDLAYAPQIDGGSISHVAALADGKAVIAGYFTTVNGTARPGLARLHADGSLDPAFDPGAGANGAILDFAAQPDGKVIIVGDFTSYRGAGRGRIARLNPDGALDLSFDSGDADGAVRQVGLLADGRITVAGDFSSIDGFPRFGLARLLPGSDPLPLSRPTALRVTMTSSTEAQLAWADTGRESGYRIERSAAGTNDWTAIGSVGANVTQFTDSQAGPGFRYRIISLGANGESQPSFAAAPLLPRTPASFTATTLSPHAIRLEWAGVERRNGSRLEASADGQTGWIEIAVLSAETTTFIDTAIPAETARFYRVASFNFAGSSAPTASASATTWPEFYDAAGGTWTGLVQPIGAFSHAMSGALTIRVGRSGAFSGTLTIGAKRVSLLDGFTPDGTAIGVVAGLPGQLNRFTISLDPQTGEGTGTLLLGANERATIRLVKTHVWSATAPCPHAGTFTLLLSPNLADATAPFGTGFGRVIISATGTLRLAGVLPDGTALGQSAQLSLGGDWPLFTPLYAGFGALRGWTKFAADDGFPANGPLRWTKPRRPLDAVERTAFSVEVNLAAARYTPRLPLWTSSSLNHLKLIRFDGSDLAALPDDTLATLDAVNAVATQAGSRVNMSISTATGLFRGTFIAPGEPRRRVFSGAILQIKASGALVEPEFRGAGFFHGRAKSGSVCLEQPQTGGSNSTTFGGVP